jgi:heme-degrading monooxygenase HmoA
MSKERWAPLARPTERTSMNKLLIPALALAVCTSSLAQPSTPPPSPTVAVVRVPTPWYAPRALVVSKMRDTVPLYAQLPGLAFKAFSIERASGEFGGLYYWRDANAAQAWFNTAWFERVKKERGVEGRVTLYEAPLSIDNTPDGTRSADGASAATAAPDVDRMLPSVEPAPTSSAGHSNAGGVATLVLIRTPAGASRQQIVAEFQKAAPAHRAIPGLLRKHFIICDNGASFGGLYLWKDEASAQAWFNHAWHERVQKTYGQAAAMNWFDTPILLPTRDAANAAPASAMIVAPAP